MKETLLSNGSISFLWLILVVMGGYLLLRKISEEDAKKQKAKIYEELEDIYFWYNRDNTILNREFDKFLEAKFGEEKAHVLECFKEQEEQDEQLYREYTKTKEKLKERLSLGQISIKEFDKKKAELWKKYDKEKKV